MLNNRFSKKEVALNCTVFYMHLSTFTTPYHTLLRNLWTNFDDSYLSERG